MNRGKSVPQGKGNVPEQANLSVREKTPPPAMRWPTLTRPRLPMTASPVRETFVSAGSNRIPPETLESNAAPHRVFAISLNPATERVESALEMPNNPDRK